MIVGQLFIALGWVLIGYGGGKRIEETDGVRSPHFFYDWVMGALGPVTWLILFLTMDDRA